METQERYETPEAPQNGTGTPPTASSPLRHRIDRIVVQVVVGQEQAGVKVGETTFNPATIFADADHPVMPWGSSLEKLIAQAIQQAEGQG
jgi:hypothetical protein